MKQFILCALIAITTTATAQTVLFEDNFDSYTLGQGIAAQSPVWESFSGENDDDAEASNEHALSAPNAMKVVHGADMVYPFGDVTSGAYDIEFNMFLHEQGYFNLQHVQDANWAVDIYFTAANEIKYADEQNAVVNSIVVGTYANDEWIHFRFHVDIDADTIFFYKNGALLHSSRFSNSMANLPSNHLDILNLYGLAGYNGVTESYYYIDDVRITQFTGSTVAIEATEQETATDITIFPNPAKDLLALTSDEQLEHIRITTLSGEWVLEQTLSGNSQQVSLADFIPGVYLVRVQTTAGTAVQRVIVQ